MFIRDRIRELRRLPARELAPNPRNWRRHPRRQREAMQGILAEIGFADALLARERDDGRLELIDGHLRAETTPDSLVPVLVLDVNEEEAIKLLATIDPLAMLAEADTEQLARLFEELHTTCEPLQALWNELAAKCEEPAGKAQPEPVVCEAYEVVIECESECAQREVYERLTGEGLRCRVVTM